MDLNKKTYSNVIDKLRAFLGGTTSTLFEDHFSRPLATALNGTEFPELDGLDAGDLTDELGKLLHSTKYTISERTPAEFMYAVRRLGKPHPSRSGGQSDEERTLDRLALRAAEAMASFREEVCIHLFHSETDGEWSSGFGLSFPNESVSAPGALTPILRSVYARCEVEEVRLPDMSSMTVYGSLSIPYRDKNAEEDNCVPASWLTAAANSLPGTRGCRLTVRFVPLSPDADDPAGKPDEIKSRFDSLCALRSALALVSEVDWNRSSSTGANMTLNKDNIYEKLKNRPKEGLDAGFNKLVENMTRASNFSENFGQTRHEKNARSTLLMNEADREIYRLGRALNSQCWKVEITLTADDETTLQTVASAMSGALQSSGRELVWTPERSVFAAGTREILPLMMFPTREFDGLEFTELESFSLKSPANAGGGLPLGRILWNGTPMGRFYLPVSALSRHAFVCGMTGAGKTNTVFKMLEAVGVPFLVIEPVKGEYRAMSGVYEDLHIYTMRVGTQTGGAEILRINPFWFPMGTSLAFHIDSIRTVIASAFEMSAAMPNILEQCLYSIYISSGWDLVTNRNKYSGQIPDEYLYPTFEDLLAEIDAYLLKADFGDEVKGNYRGAMSTRLRSFLSGSKGLLLNTRSIPDYTALSRGRSIIELEGLADDADKCLVMGTILVQYFENLKLTFKSDGSVLKHVMVIEEAHRLFKNVPKQVPGVEGANVAGQLVESLSNIMAEIRAFGEGMIIVDQSPSKIAEDVIKNSGTKLIHRIDNTGDNQLLQASLLIPDDQTSLPALNQGEALVRTEGMIRPGKIKMDVASCKERYALSDSFASIGADDSLLQLEFTAAALLTEETLKERTQLLLMSLVCCLSKDDNPDYWYRKTDEAASIIRSECIDKQNMDGVFSDETSLVTGIAVAAIRQMLRYAERPLDLRSRCFLQMFLGCLMDVYKAKKSEGISKNADWLLLSHFLKTRLSNLITLLDEIK